MSNSNNVKNVLNISLSSVCAASLALAAGTTETIQLARFYGKATDVRTNKSTEYGDRDVIIGDFRGVDAASGQVYKSNVINLVGGVRERVLLGLQENDEFEFAYDFWAEPEPKGKSYNIGFTDLLEDNKKPDPLLSLFAKLPPMSKLSK